MTPNGVDFHFFMPCLAYVAKFVHAGLGSVGNSKLGNACWCMIQQQCQFVPAGCRAPAASLLACSNIVAVLMSCRSAPSTCR